MEVTAILVAGVVGAGVMMVLVRLTKGRVPRWMIPVGAVAAMLATVVSGEYGWYGRTLSSLPPNFSVAQTVETSAPWRPWSYVFPITEQFSAIDMGAIRPNRDHEGLVTFDLFFFGRSKPVRAVQMMVDCQTRQRADPVPGGNAQPVWRDKVADDPVIATVCGAP